MWSENKLGIRTLERVGAAAERRTVEVVSHPSKSPRLQPQKRLHLTQFKWFAIASIAPALEKLNGGWSQSDPESGEYRCPSYLFGVARSIYSRACSVKVGLMRFREDSPLIHFKLNKASSEKRTSSVNICNVIQKYIREVHVKT